MNLEYDDEEAGLVRQAGEILEKIAPIPATGRAVRPADWPALAGAGWSGLGAAVQAQELPLAVAVGLSRQAGRQLLAEELVSTGWELSALVNSAGEDSRAQLHDQLNERPAVLLGDGRRQAVPVVTGDITAGCCFGAAPGCGVYRLLGQEGGLVLQRWDGAPPAVAPLAGLSPSIAAVTVDPAAGEWRDYPLGWPEADLGPLRTQVLLAHSAALIGCAERLLEITCQHVRSRVQFGVPIGSFQAVKHGLADVHTALVVAWNAVLSAAADGAEPLLAPLVARVLTVQAALAAARAGAQFHGGMGFTAELNVHLFLKAILDGVQRGGAPDDVAVELGRRFVAAAC